jgi:hypothetical protein
MATPSEIINKATTDVNGKTWKQSAKWWGKDAGMHDGGATTYPDAREYLGPEDVAASKAKQHNVKEYDWYSLAKNKDINKVNKENKQKMEQFADPVKAQNKAAKNRLMDSIGRNNIDEFAAERNPYKSSEELYRNEGRYLQDKANTNKNPVKFNKYGADAYGYLLPGGKLKQVMSGPVAGTNMRIGATIKGLPAVVGAVPDIVNKVVDKYGDQGDNPSELLSPAGNAIKKTVGDAYQNVKGLIRKGLDAIPSRSQAQEEPRILPKIKEGENPVGSGYNPRFK